MRAEPNVQAAHAVGDPITVAARIAVGADHLPTAAVELDAVEDRVAVGLGRAAAEHQGTRMATAAQDEGGDDEESARALHGVPFARPTARPA